MTTEIDDLEYDGLADDDNFEEAYDPYCGMCHDEDYYGEPEDQSDSMWVELWNLREALESLAESLRPDWADEVADRLEGPRRLKKQYF